MRCDVTISIEKTKHRHTPPVGWSGYVPYAMLAHRRCGRKGFVLSVSCVWRMCGMEERRVVCAYVSVCCVWWLMVKGKSASKLLHDERVTSSLPQCLCCCI